MDRLFKDFVLAVVEKGIQHTQWTNRRQNRVSLPGYLIGNSLLASSGPANETCVYLGLRLPVYLAGITTLAGHRPHLCARE